MKYGIIAILTFNSLDEKVNMAKLAVKFPRVASYGHTVSHAKNRRNRAFKYNLHTVTVTDEKGKKVKMRVPAKLIRTLKKQELK